VEIVKQELLKLTFLGPDLDPESHPCSE